MSDINSTKLTVSQKNRLNKVISGLITNVYFDSLPLTRIANMIEEGGGNAEEMNGIYCGADGRLDPPAQIAKNCWLSLTWHKMDVTGRYEVVAYVS